MTARRGRGRIYRDVSETVGDTPLVRINRMAEEAGARATVLAKLEFFNPLSSVKDRVGLAMIETAEAEGRIQPGRQGQWFLPYLNDGLIANQQRKRWR